MKKEPLFSIITVCRNSGSTIEGTIKSLLEQSFREYEYIIIDGNSTDGTLAIIEKYRGQIDIVISEPDKGIYDAMNKGITNAKGRYLYFLNTGDSFFDSHVLRDIAEFARIKNYPNIIFGDAALVNNGKFSHIHSREGCDVIDLFYLPINHQSTFIQRVDLIRFDASLKLLADYDVFLKVLFRPGSKVGYVKRTIPFYDLNGISVTDRGLLDRELLIVRKRHFNSTLTRILTYTKGTRWMHFVKRRLIRSQLCRSVVLGEFDRKQISNV